jgi:hypothetical protein
MWLFNKKKRRERKVFGFLCDPKLALGVKFIAADLKVPIYTVAEHLLQLGVAQMYPNLEDDVAKRQLQEHLINQHLLAPALDEQNENEYAHAAAAKARKAEENRRARIAAAIKLVRVLETDGVPPERIKTELARLETEAKDGVPEISEK